MNIQCLKCKGAKLACGRAFCPIISKSEARFKIAWKMPEKEFFGPAPAPFVGRFGYPYVNVGILSPGHSAENSSEYDAPRQWAHENYSIQKIVDLRSSLVNSRSKAYVKDKPEKITEISQEVGMAAKPVDVEISLKQKPNFRLNTDYFTAPMGPNATIEKAKLASNPNIPTKVEKVFSDTDLKAVPAISYLYSRGFDENFLSKILSVGTVGVKKDRKLVPTRWSITAVDDSLGKEAISSLKQFPEQGHLAFFGSYLGNYYIVLLFPGAWSYELFEAYMPKASWNQSENIDFTTDYEPFSGRKTYAENCAGGYYAARLAVAEKMKELKIQASVLCIRIITGEYAVPLGVWVVREASRKAMLSKPIEFDSRDLMLAYAKAIAKRKFGCSIDSILSSSILLKELKHQTRLSSFA